MVDAAEGDGDVAGVGRDGELRHLDVDSGVSAGEGGQAGRVARHGGAGVGPVRDQQPHPHPALHSPSMSYLYMNYLDMFC